MSYILSVFFNASGARYIPICPFRPSMGAWDEAKSKHLLSEGARCFLGQGGRPRPAQPCGRAFNLRCMIAITIRKRRRDREHVQNKLRECALVSRSRTWKHALEVMPQISWTEKWAFRLS
ncbi:hypothetical protein BDN70DRAFT_559579 [Pholiota conissans]|uniref:Uncharacterized protein n=1 Tax=Pholiota conissans TaxID=109636 RepID=A0A9P5Z707_9AGAR|nr:hypothetical protein BDN70DRAFT_559579 [Pholiota conissans]